jgi:NAD(P)-dependent dehydrogenase (short-subunit alcohol dehydrogenase family)
MTGLLDSRVILVTGASRGIGRAAARAFALEGAHVVLVARDSARLEGLITELRCTGGHGTSAPCDLSDREAVDLIGKLVRDRWGRLDGLLANAGVLGALEPIVTVNPTAFDTALNVNVLANLWLIQALHSSLLASSAATALFMSSNAAHMHTPHSGAYQASKAALESLVLTYAAECVTGPKVNIFRPGGTQTDMAAIHSGAASLTMKPPEAVAIQLVPLLSASCTVHGEILAYDPDFRSQPQTEECANTSIAKGRLPSDIGA